MKISNRYKIFLLLLFIMLFSLNDFAQNNLNADSVKTYIAKQSFVFIPQTVLPSGGVSRYLTDDYSLTIKRDSISSNLPYFGVSHTAPIDPTKGILDFDCGISSFDVTQPKKDKWQVIIKPALASNVRELDLTVFDNGNADLVVISNYNQGISFSGYIKRKL